MRRKSERNKTKGSPEKKIEKPTRKSTRRRGKRSPSTSSEQDPLIEDAAKSATQLQEIEKETSVQTRLQSKEVEQVPHKHEEKVSSSDVNIKVDSPEDEDNGGSVWKVARADASPGEIQKLKLCRQRNTSEPSSDTPPLNRKNVKSSSKWQESGEGVAEEADSADEQLVSCTRTLSSTEQPNDPSSSYPGQDSNEEVSDSKEILPETTSANLLSDDKPNIDQHGESNEANCTAQVVDIEPGKPGSMTPSPVPAPSANGEETVTTIIVKEDKPVEDISEKPTETFVKETSVENVRRDMNSEDEGEEEEEEEDKAKMHRPVDSSSDSNDESRSKRSRTSSDRTSPRATRRKHRNKYRDSSNSDTPDSEDEPIDRKISESYVEEEEEEQERKPNTEYLQENDKQQSMSPERTNSHSNNVEKIEMEHSKTVEDKLDKDTTEKLEQSTPAITQVVAHKPVKVNLKRSFSTRILFEKNEMKRDDADASINESSSQNKENGNEQEPKCVPRKRRWGTALSTDTAPSFSISSDSLKALVPGAKPLSINEVRLSKDDDEDRDRHRSNDKRYNSSDITYDKTTDENLQKNGAAKKGNGKVDNHIVTRRKISIVKEMPHIKSPSPPTSKPTNILLIKNLVRPFTLNQIKELLSRTGTIVENGFWMDRIKSKCIVEYSNEDQAFETRQALHGISWPMSNPKKLHVEYATKEDMETARESSKEQPVARKTEPLSDSWQQDWNRDEKTNTKVTVVREWDLGKEDGQQHIREKEREKKEHDKKRRVRSRSPILDAHLSAPARKFKKKEDDPPPAKLLDDLFRKTKATPCIYWLPLTNEQIVVKEEMRRQHMAEHARRLEEMRRADRNRDSRRRRSPRK